MHFWTDAIPYATSDSLACLLDLHVSDSSSAAVSEALLVKGYELVSVGIVITHADRMGRWYNDSLLMSPCSSALQLQVFKKLRSSIL